MATPPANWYPDPSNAAQERYWDGTNWTEQYRPTAAVPPPPMPPAYGAPPYAAPGPYGAPGYGPQVTKTNTLSIVSLITGIIGFVCCFLWVGEIAALVTGIMAYQQIQRTGERGKGMAIAGIVLGALGLALVLFSVATGNYHAHIGTTSNTP